jgi:hypothetical protein
VYLRFGRYDESSTPEVGECGLAVDINHIPDMSTGNAIAPIECLSNVEKTIIINRLFQSPNTFSEKKVYTKRKVTTNLISLNMYLYALWILLNVDLQLTSIIYPICLLEML